MLLSQSHNHTFIINRQLKFIVMASQDRFRKNQSMNSTHYMSCNQSYATNFHT